MEEKQTFKSNKSKIDFIKYAVGEVPEETVIKIPSDEVNHPEHYAKSKYECIEVMQEIYGKDAVKTFCLLNSFKYLWRCYNKHKTPMEDIRKAEWYIKKYRELD